MSDLVELKSLDDAVALLDKWIRAHMRLQLELNKANLRIEYLEDLLERLDPFLPEEMQDEEARARNIEIYSAIQRHVEEEKVPF